MQANQDQSDQSDALTGNEHSALELAAALGEVARSVSSTLDLHVIFERIFDMLGLFVPYDSATIALLQDDRLVIAAERGFPASMRVRETTLPLYPNATHYPVIAEACSLVLDDAQAHPGWQPVPGHDLVRAWIGTPLLVEEQVIGLLTIDKWEKNAYNGKHVALAQAFANHVAIAIRNAKLYADSQRAYAELRRTQDELSHHERLRAFGELALGVAHDFNNVLTGILGNAQMLLQETTDSATQAGLRVIEQAAQDGAATVRRLQDFARPGAAGPLVPVDLAAVAQAALDLIRPRWQGLPLPGAPALNVITEFSSVYTAPVEAADLRQVLINLILNALDAMPNGGTLRIATAGSGREAYVVVQDTGVGIAPELQPQIFDPFVTTKGMRGSGMGLMMSQALVARYGGRITVESTPGAGSIFTVWLPRGHCSIETAPAPAAPKDVAGCSVLIVDDDTEIRELIARALRARGYQITNVSTGAEALTLLEHNQYHLIITDLGLAGISGWELIRRIRERDQQIGIILVSGWGQQVTTAVVQDQLVDQMLSKPFSLDDLYASVHVALEAATGRKQAGTAKRSN